MRRGGGEKVDIGQNKGGPPKEKGDEGMSSGSQVRCHLHSPVRHGGGRSAVEQAVSRVAWGLWKGAPSAAGLGAPCRWPS